MDDRHYRVGFEVAGPTAMFTRPDSGAVPISYPAPTKSALKSMFECVAYSEHAYFEPSFVEICSPVVYHAYTTNYRGPLREGGKTNFQLLATVLENVRYKVYGEVLAIGEGGRGQEHALQEVFTRRLRQGYLHSTPFLGWREFVPSYFGVLRDSTAPDRTIDLEIPSMLVSMYNRPIKGAIGPRYRQNVRIVSGVLAYAQ